MLLRKIVLLNGGCNQVQILSYIEYVVIMPCVTVFWLDI